jgi:hypothetical protein
LSWKTPKENDLDKDLHGTRLRGEMVANSKLTADIVLTIKRSKDSARKLSDRFGVNPTTIEDIRRGEAWVHVQ